MKKYLLVFGILAIVFMVMPTAMARFSGQHTFNNGSSVDCTKCHPSINSELMTSEAHNWSATSVSAVCKNCHIPNRQTNAISGGYLNSYQTGDTSTYHAAALIECTFCHSENNGSATELGNVIPATNVSAEMTGNLAAHQPLFERARNSSGADTTDWLKGSNEACVACHTAEANVTVTGEYSNLNITANLSNNCASGDANCYKAAGTSAWWNISMEAVN